MIPEGKQRRYAGLIIALIALLVYANSLGNGYVWDDHNVLEANPALQGPPLDLFSSIDVTRDYEQLPYYRPLTLMTFLGEERLHGLAPLPMHLVNVLLHALAAFLVFRLALSLCDNVVISALAGLLIAVHPVNTESVDFLTGGRNTMLACCFAVLAWLAHQRSIERGSFPAAIAGGFFLCAGMFSKETALMIGPFILAQEIVDHRHHSDVLVARRALRLLPYAAAATVYLVMRWKTLSDLGIQISILPGFGADQLRTIYKTPDLLARLMDIVYIIPRYFLTIIRPTALTPRYDIPQSFGEYALPLAFAWALILAGLAWILTRGRSRTTIFGLCWSAAFYLPVSGVVMFPSSQMADRYLYLPAIGLWLVMADQAVRLLKSRPAARKYGIAGAAIVLLLLASLTVMRNRDWKNDIALFGKFAEQYPEDAYAHAGLGNAYFGERDRDTRYLDLAEGEYEKALSMNPMVPGVHTNMGFILLARGDSEGAVRQYTMALAAYPLEKIALLNRAIAYENLGRGKDALLDFKRFLSIPGYELADARPYAEARVSELSQ